MNELRLEVVDLINKDDEAYGSNNLPLNWLKRELEREVMTTMN